MEFILTSISKKKWGACEILETEMGMVSRPSAPCCIGNNSSSESSSELHAHYPNCARHVRFMTRPCFAVLVELEGRDRSEFCLRHKVLPPVSWLAEAYTLGKKALFDIVMHPYPLPLLFRVAPTSHRLKVPRLSFSSLTPSRGGSKSLEVWTEIRSRE